MPEKDKSGEQGFGKYILIKEIQNKHKSLFDINVSENYVSGILYLEGIHFNLMYFPLKHLGYKAVVNSIADLYCRGQLPESIMVQMGVSVRFKKEDIESLVEGISLACERYSLKISTLDISSSLTGLTLGISAFGTTGDLSKRVVPESTDLVCVTGDLGAAYMGLQLLERERRVFEEGGTQPKLKGFEYVIGRQLKPELKTSLLDKVRNNEIPLGLIRTVRDGLASELLHISSTTGLGCRIYHDKLPVDRDTASAGRELGFEPLIAALNGGDDFEFVFTVPVKEHEKIEGIEGINIIGHLVPQEEGNSLVLPDGSLAELKAQGWGEDNRL